MAGGADDEDADDDALRLTRRGGDEEVDVLDAMYGDDGEAAGAGEWASLRAVLGAARAGDFDEEPSPRIDALLMAAARAHAPKPRVPWWSRLAAWMRPTFAHPALAGAAALVIVGGAAGVMYKRGQVQMVQPRVASQERAPSPPGPGPGSGPGVRQQVGSGTEAPVPTLSTTTLEDVPNEVMQPEVPRSGWAPSGSGAPGTGSTAAGTAARKGTGATGGGASAGSGAAGPVVAGHSGGDQGGGAAAGDKPTDSFVRAGGVQSAPRQVQRDERERDGEGPEQAEGETVGIATDDDVAAPRKKNVEARVEAKPDSVAPPGVTAPPPPPPPPPARPIEEPDRAGAARDAVVVDSTSTSAAEQQRSQNRTLATQLLGQGRTAAKAGNCGVVRTISERVRKLDASYHREVFARDVDIAKCL